MQQEDKKKNVKTRYWCRVCQVRLCKNNTLYFIQKKKIKIDKMKKIEK